MNLRKTDKKDKLLCRILKQGGSWGLLNRINKRSDETLFMDIDIKSLFLEIQDFFNDEDDYIKHLFHLRKYFIS